MNKFVIQFSPDSNFLVLAGKSFIFNNQLDAIDYFKSVNKCEKNYFIKDCNITNADQNAIFLTDYNNKIEYPNCFWAIQPN